MFRSTDGGSTWQQTRTGLDTQSVRSLAVGRNGYVFAGTNDRFVYRSKDKGISWERFSGWQFGNSIQPVYTLFVLRDGSIVAPSIAVGIFRSTDNGNSWERWDTGIDEPYNSVDFAYAPDGSLYTGAGFGGREKLFTTAPTSSVGDGLIISAAEQASEISISQSGASLTVKTGLSSLATVVRVYDLLGRTVVEHQTDSGLSNGVIVIDLAHVPKGHYYCWVATANGAEVRLIAVR